MENVSDPTTPSVSTSLYTTANASTLDPNSSVNTELGDSILILENSGSDSSFNREENSIGTITLNSTADVTNSSVVEISSSSTPIATYTSHKKLEESVDDASFSVVIDDGPEGYNPSSEEDSELDLEDDAEEAVESHGLTLEDSALPETVTILTTPDGGCVYLVGTAHFSKESQEDVAKVIQAVQPHVVLVELCKARVNILQLDEQTILEEAKNINFEKIKSTIQQNGLFHGIMNILLLSMSAHLTKELGMAPGGEFRRAFAEAKKVPQCVVHLGDRPIKLTLQRALASLSWWQTLKLTWHIMSKESISKEEVERCKQRDLLEEMLAELTGEFPAFSRVFVAERDLYLANSLQLAALPIPCPASPLGYIPAKVVGVVGIGHVPGIVQHWGKVDQDAIPAIMEIPPPSLTSRVLKLTMKASLIGLLVWGCVRVLPLPPFPRDIARGAENSLRTLKATVQGLFEILVLYMLNQKSSTFKRKWNSYNMARICMSSTGGEIFPLRKIEYGLHGYVWEKNRCSVVSYKIRSYADKNSGSSRGSKCSSGKGKQNYRKLSGTNESRGFEEGESKAGYVGGGGGDDGDGGGKEHFRIGDQQINDLDEEEEVEAEEDVTCETSKEMSKSVNEKLIGGVSTPEIMDRIEVCELVDNYEHPCSDIFYVPTNIPGPGVKSEDFESAFVGCNCSAKLDAACYNTGCKCYCLDRSLGPNYDLKGLLVKEKLSGNLPVFECSTFCSCAPNCGNRKVQFGPLADLEIFDASLLKNKERSDVDSLPVEESSKGPPCLLPKSDTFSGKGLGLRTLKHIPRGTFICEYAGEVLGKKEALKRWETDNSLGLPNYILALVEWSSNSPLVNIWDPSISGTSRSCLQSNDNSDCSPEEDCEIHEGVKNKNCMVTYIDPTRMGNIGRYANHSCDPNAVAVAVRIAHPVPSLCLFAVKDLMPGDEVTFDYAGLDKSSANDVLENRSAKIIETSNDLSGTSVFRLKEKERKNRKSKSKVGVLEDVLLAEDMASFMYRDSRTKCLDLTNVTPGHPSRKSHSEDRESNPSYVPEISQVFDPEDNANSPPSFSSKRKKICSVEFKKSNEMDHCHLETESWYRKRNIRIIRTPCLCGTKNCRKYLPFSGNWI